MWSESRWESIGTGKEGRSGVLRRTYETGRLYFMLRKRGLCEVAQKTVGGVEE